MPALSKESSPKLGDIYMMYFNGSASEQRGWRPGIVFSNNLGNAKSPNVIAIPLTKIPKKTNMPTHVIIRASDSGLKVDSIALCENPEIMSKSKIKRYITTLSEDYMKQVVKAYLLATSGIAVLTIRELEDTWQKSKKLNKAV